MARWTGASPVTAAQQVTALLCNAAILRDSCYCQGEAIYGDELEVLRDLTPSEMEDLLLRLAEGEALPEERGGTFDLQRFADMKGE